MFALMKPSSVATRSNTRGTSCGCTVVTETSGAAGPACGALREQAVNSAQNDAQAAVIVSNRRLPITFVSPFLMLTLGLKKASRFHHSVRVRSNLFGVDIR